MKKLNCSKEFKHVLTEVSTVADFLWQKGWAERNGGNISINVSAEFKKTKKSVRFIENSNIPAGLENQAFFVTGTGCRMRDLIQEATITSNSCVIKIASDCKGYYFVWGGEPANFMPTSELPSHLTLHLDLINRGTNHKAVVHTHPTELIALTHAPDYAHFSAKLTKQLWKMLPEVRAFVPKGIEIVPYTLPGSAKLAELTVKALQQHDIALWEKHGAVATGETVQTAFDFIDVANKGAKIFLQCLAANFIPEGISDQALQELAQEFNL